MCTECATEYHLTQCDDGQCILDSVLCDGVLHCDDTSDEISQCGEMYLRIINIVARTNGIIICSKYICRILGINISMWG